MFPTSSAYTSSRVRNSQFITTDVEGSREQRQEMIERESATLAKQAEDSLRQLANGRAAALKLLWNQIPRLEKCPSSYGDSLAAMARQSRLPKPSVLQRSNLNKAMCLELDLVRVATNFLSAYKLYCEWAVRQREELGLTDTSTRIVSKTFRFEFATSSEVCFFFRFINQLKPVGHILALTHRDIEVLKEFAHTATGTVRDHAKYLIITHQYGIYESQLGCRARDLTISFNTFQEFIKNDPGLCQALSQLYYTSNLSGIIANFLYKENFENIGQAFRDDTSLIENLESLLHGWRDCEKDRQACFKNNVEEIKKLRPKKNAMSFVQTYSTFKPPATHVCNLMNYQTFSPQLVRELTPFIPREPVAEMSTAVPEASSQASCSSDMQEVLDIIDARMLNTEAQTHRKFDYQYHERVLEWFKDSPRYFMTIESYRILPQKEKQLEHLFHGFSTAVDNYLVEYGNRSVWVNPTTGAHENAFSIPGKIEVDQREFWGTFEYCLGSEGVIYHRYFSRKSSRELVQMHGDNLYKIAFPEMDQEDHLVPERVGVYEPPMLRGTVKRHRLFNSIHIKDKMHLATLILLPKRLGSV